MVLGTQPCTAGVLTEPSQWICVGCLSATAVHVLISPILPALHAVCYLSYVLNGQLCVDRSWQKLLSRMITRLSLECLVSRIEVKQAKMGGTEKNFLPL